MQISRVNKINIEKHPESSLILAVGLYQSGRIFIYPTDTIYGIGGNPFDKNVVNKIKKIKGRVIEKQFIWLLSDFENLLNFVEITCERHINFLQSVWPGPVSVILNLNDRTKKITSFETVAVRIPNNNFCQKLLREIRQPLISTSVNRSGQTPINRVEQITEEFSQDIDAIIFHSKQVQELSSTIIDLTSEKPMLIREGSVKFIELLKNFN